MNTSLEKIVDPHTEIPRGFLTEVWNTKEEKPQLTAPERWFYFLEQGFANFIALPVTSAVAVGTVSVCVILFLGASILFSNIERVLVGAGNALTISAFLRSEVSEEDGRRIAAEIGKSVNVKSSAYLSKRDALIQFRQTLAGRASLLNGLESDNPLPASIEINVNPAKDAHQAAVGLVASLRKHNAVEEVIHGSEWLDRAELYLGAFRLTAILLSALVLGVVCFLIASTTKLIMYARRTEIEIMQLVGATDSFIRTPFLIGSALQGFIGAAIGIAIAYTTFLSLRAYVGGLEVFGPTTPQVFFASLPLLILVTAGAVVFAVISSVLSLRRLLDV